MQAQADYQRLLHATHCASLACLRALPAEVPLARRARACSTLLASPFLRSPHPPVPLLPSGPSPSAPPEHIPSSYRSTSPLCPLQRVFASVAWDQATFGPTIDPSGELPAPVTLLATSAPGLGPPLPHLCQDWAHPLLHLHREWARPLPHLHGNWACRCYSTASGLAPMSTSAPGLDPSLPHLYLTAATSAPAGAWRTRVQSCSSRTCCALVVAARMWT